ncbi:MAG: hypothetical protein ACI88H_001144 [Cocleimonas sp.]|jgi:hypothetical protein
MFETKAFRYPQYCCLSFAKKIIEYETLTTRIPNSLKYEALMFETLIRSGKRLSPQLKNLGKTTMSYHIERLIHPKAPKFSASH